MEIPRETEEGHSSDSVPSLPYLTQTVEPQVDVRGLEEATSLARTERQAQAPPGDAVL